MTRFILTILILIGAAWSNPLYAKAQLPSADAAKTADHPAMKRYEGSLILSQTRREYDSFTMPLSVLKAVPGKKVGSLTVKAYEPEQKLTLEGAYTRTIYLGPEGRSSVEIFRNYLDEVTANGGKVLYQCQGANCGGDPTRSVGGNGGIQSLAMYLFPPDELDANLLSNAWCGAAVRPIADQHYLVAKLGASGPTVSVLTYRVRDKNKLTCGAFNGRTIAVLDILQDQARDQKMVTVKADQMAAQLSREGTVALYGIFFDTGKASVQSKSDSTLEQVGKLMAADPSLQLLVVGHTDNQGSFKQNMKLSNARASAVVQSLTSRFGVAAKRLHPVGVSFAAPRASNDNDAGRAINRRVELVKAR